MSVDLAGDLDAWSSPRRSSSGTWRLVLSVSDTTRIATRARRPGTDVVQAVPVEGGPRRSRGDVAGTLERETIAEPAKLLRIASMVREPLDETRQASLDESGRGRLADVYQRAVASSPRCSRRT